jgi:S-(hydroxymethyl)glutathione dehydrogenase / alcohol dehydrogenase
MLISLIEQGKLDVGSMVSRTMHLHEVNDAIKAMQDGEVIRSVLV